MLLSMTGFGEARHQQETLSVAVEVRTINSRYFKLNLRSTESYAPLETHVEALVRQHVKRGTVQVQIRVDRVRSSDEYRIDLAVLEGYRRQLESHSALGSEPIRLVELLSLPGIVDQDGDSRSADFAADWPAIEKPLVEALEALTKMRAEEGNHLREDLLGQCQSISAHLDRIAARAPMVVAEYQERLLERMQRLLEAHQVSIDVSDVLREVSLFSERGDISEEIVRLRSHLDQFAKTIDLGESTGRKLDFITQEMFREINTIGSKSNDVEIPRHVVEIKTAIERIREQVQNVE